MNPWDIFTYLMVVVLAGGALIIFGFFLRDLKGVLKGQKGPDEDKR